MSSAAAATTTSKLAAIATAAAEKFSLRVAAPSDAAALGQLASRTFSETFGHLYPPEQLGAYLTQAYNVDTIRSDIECADKYTVLLFPKQQSDTSDQPCAYGMLHDRSVRTGEDPALAEHSLEIKRVYVDSAFHGSGAAYLLMEHLMGVVRAKQPPRRHVWLGVWENNVKAQKFYAKYSFREVGEHTFLVGETMDRDLLYELEQEVQ